MLLYLIILILSFIITWAVKIIAIKKSIIDIPNERSSHTIPTPRGGGIAIVITWYLGITYLLFSGLIDKNLFYALLFGLVIVGISLLDDIIGVYFLIRLGSHVLAAVGALYFVGGLNKIDVGFFTIENKVLFTGLAFIGIVWFINIFNFIDGIDGYAGTETVFISLAIYVLFNDNIILILAFASLGFLFWNWQKAKIFMGDVGSTFIGFTFATFAIWYQNTNKSSIFVWIILSSIFWFDATLTLFRRFLNKEKLSYAHKKHAYQRIVQIGFSHQKTVLFAIIINGGLFLLTLFGIMNPKFVLFSLLLSVIFLYFLVKQIDKKKDFN